MTQTTHSHASGQNWVTYYQAVEGRPPRETLLKALAMFDAKPLLDRPRFAVDLGCGDGRDTVELLRRGWQVLAIDGEEKAFDRLRDRSVEQDLQQTQLMRFETLTLPPAIDLINASFCLPFCPPADFPHLWQTIVTSLKPGGCFCGQLFGDRDSWTNTVQLTIVIARNEAIAVFVFHKVLPPELSYLNRIDSWTVYPNRTHHTNEQIQVLLQPFEIEWLDEEEHPGVTAIGEEKYWHIFHIVARKKAAI